MDYSRDPVKTINIVEIDDKYDSGWPPDLIYSDYNVMIILKFTNNVMESIQRANTLKKEFDNILGKDNWIFYDNYGKKFDDVIFTKGIDKIFYSMLLDSVIVKSIVDEIRIFKETK